MNIHPGEVAPDFSLPDADGTMHALSDFHGHWTVLFFYPRDNTPGCTTEVCAFRDIYDRFVEVDAVVIGISTDPPRSHERFIRKHDLPFLLLSDEDRTVVQLYGVYGEKSFMGRVFNGTHRQSVLIAPDGTVARVYPKVKPKVHAGEVLADMQELIAATTES